MCGPPSRVRFFFVSLVPGSWLSALSRDGDREMVQVFAEKLQGIDRASLEAAITPVLSSHGVGAAEITYQMEPTGWVLRVTVESLRDGVAGGPVETETRVDPIELGLLAEISRDLSSALDVAGVIHH